MERSCKSARKRYTSAGYLGDPCRFADMFSGASHVALAAFTPSGPTPANSLPNTPENRQNGAKCSIFSLPTTINIIVGKHVWLPAGRPLMRGDRTRGIRGVT